MGDQPQRLFHFFVGTSGAYALAREQHRDNFFAFLPTPETTDEIPGIQK
jgi:hypothetical protein